MFLIFLYKIHFLSGAPPPPSWEQNTSIVFLTIVKEAFCLSLFLPLSHTHTHPHTRTQAHTHWDVTILPSQYVVLREEGGNGLLVVPLPLPSSPSQLEVKWARSLETKTSLSFQSKVWIEPEASLMRFQTYFEPGLGKLRSSRRPISIKGLEDWPEPRL